MKIRRTTVLVGLGVAALAAAQVASGHRSPNGRSGQIVRSVAPGPAGLDNPRGVSIGPDGSVYVASAGSAGKHCMGKGQNEQCAGFTGYITKFVDGRPQRLASGFMSGGGRDGSFSVGVDDVAVTPGGYLYAIMTSFGKDASKFGPRVTAQNGKVLQILRGGAKHAVADVSRVEYTLDPARDGVDSNPYSIATSPAGLAVADAGGNDLLLVAWNGGVRVLASFPARGKGKHALQSVPTSVAVGPDGAYYVGELGGDGVPGMARVWRVVPGRAPTVWLSGFTAITGLDFGPDGSLYVAELVKHGLRAAQHGDLKGAVIRVFPNGTRTELAAGRLAALGGIAVARDGTVYVTENSIFTGRGRLTAIH